LTKFKVTFEDGKSEIVLAKYATHAWSVAKHIRPYHEVVNIEDVEKQHFPISQGANDKRI
jgi:hypothetical protein